MGCNKYTPASAGARAARRLSSMWDRARDMYTRAGLRPYSVTIVRARAAGANHRHARGDGPIEVVGQWEILPVPKVESLSALSEVLDADQLRESGAVLISEISLSYSEDVLLGRGEDGTPVGRDEQVYWEIQYFDPQGRPTERRRFVASSAPTDDAARAQWTITLTRAPNDRAR